MVRSSIYWDLVRVFASTLVVAVHAGFRLGFSLAVPCFAFLLVRLGKRRADEGAAQLLRRHSRALLGPWVLWSLLYLALRGLAGNRAGGPGRPVVDGLLIGGFIHLWFLPFALAARTLTQRLDFADSARKARLVATVAMVVVAVVLCLAQAEAQGWPRPAPQWMSAAPAALLAWSIRTTPIARPFLIATIAAIASLIPTARVAGLGVLAGLLVLDQFQASLPVARTRWSQALASLSWPVYLIHPAVLIGGQRLLGIQSPSWRFFFALATSATVGLLILRVPLLKRVLLVESNSKRVNGSHNMDRRTP